jgi:transcriptional regulator with XRE-family HTH domain
MTETIADRIKKARVAAGLTQAELAELTGCKWQQVSRWERVAASPRAKTIRALADALNVYDLWLSTGEGPMRPHTADNFPLIFKERASEKLSNYGASPAAFELLEQLSDSAEIQIIGQTLQAMLKALPTRGINLDDPRLAQMFKAIVRRSIQTNEPPNEKMVLDELIKPSGE